MITFIKHLRAVKQRRGVAILFAVLLTTVVLTVGLALIDIITKQIILSLVSTNSQYAYYAANVGRECAYYWDSEAHVFILHGADPSGVVCGNIPMGNYSREDSYGGLDYSAYNFTIDLPGNPATCAAVRVTKTGDGHTAIDSKGYNEACGSANNPRRVEREIVVSY